MKLTLKELLQMIKPYYDDLVQVYKKHMELVSWFNAHTFTCKRVKHGEMEYYYIYVRPSGKSSGGFYIPVPNEDIARRLTLLLQHLRWISDQLVSLI